MKRKLITAILMLLITTLWAADNFVSFKKSTGMIPLTGSSDTIVYDKAEWKGVIMAINNLRQDLKAVTGSDNANIIVATVGKSPIAKKYEKYAKMLKGKYMNWQHCYDLMYPAGAARVIEIEEELEVKPVDGNTYQLDIRPLTPGLVFQRIIVDLGGHGKTFLHGVESDYTRK